MTYEHYSIGLNPDRADGLWPTREAALQGFASQFCQSMEAAQGRNVYVRIAPKLTEIRLFEEREPMFKIVGRFSVEVEPPVRLRGDDTLFGFGVGK
jgi:hypothetical protein